MYLEKAKPDKQINHAFENEIPMILWLGEEEIKAGDAKLKVANPQFRYFISMKNTRSS
jgi:histidyl-tRNA synthetase